MPGNRKEALNKTLGGTLDLGLLSEGQHQGTLFVQQIVGQRPSETDTDISVRHLIQWKATVQNGEVVIDFKNPQAPATFVSIAAPAWDGTVRPHRVTLLSDEAVVDGRAFPMTTAALGRAHEEKARVLMREDLSEFRREYNRRERREKRRESR